MSVLTSEITIDYLIEVTQAFMPIFGTLAHMYLRIIHLDKVSSLRMFL